VRIFETSLSDRDINTISETLRFGQLGFGPNVEKFEKEFEPFSNKRYNIATNSASASAFMIFAYLKERYGACDVYTTSLGFISPVWAAKHHGHHIVFVDVNEDLLFDRNDYLLTKKDNDRQVVLMPVLYGGVSDIQDWKTNGDEVVVVDSAHCVTPKIECDYSFFSFHPYKPICTSDGGMISTNCEKSNDYFRMYRNFGRLNIGSSYDIIQDGFKFYMNNLNATIGLTQIKSYYDNLAIRKKNFEMLQSDLGDGSWLLKHDRHSSYYFATLITERADELNRNNQLARHYPLLHKTKLFKNNDRVLQNTETLFNKIVNLPLHDEAFCLGDIK